MDRRLGFSIILASVDFDEAHFGFGILGVEYPSKNYDYTYRALFDFTWDDDKAIRLDVLWIDFRWLFIFPAVLVFALVFPFRKRMQKETRIRYWRSVDALLRSAGTSGLKGRKP